MSDRAENGHSAVHLAEDLGRLLPHHARLLEDSAIAPHVARGRGYRSAVDADELAELGFASRQRRVPGLLVPLHSVDGRVALYQLRPDEPRHNEKGKAIKYETPTGSRMLLDVPPAVRGIIGSPGVPLWITEGARKADAAVSIELCCVALIGVWNWRGTNGAGGKTALPDWESVHLDGRRVYLAFDSDVMQKTPVAKALERLKGFLEHRGAHVRLVYLPADEDGAKVGLDDFLAAGHDERDLLELATAELRSPADAGKGRSQASRLVAHALGDDVEYFHTPDSEAWATVPVGEHRENLPLGSRAFRVWLGRRMHEAGEAVGAQAIQDALPRLEGEALYAGAEHEVHVRLGAHEGTLYLDLGDPARQAVEIRPDGWRLTASAPVKFRRAGGTRPLPQPVAGGALEELRALVNVRDEQDWILLAGWLVGAFAPRGPYPLLILHGEQGSAKSTTARLLRALIDPAYPELRAEPRDVRELMIAATRAHLLVYDNLSHVPSWLSDALCRLATGGGFAARALFTDAEEVLFDAQRPVILTGIDELASRSDLLDRALLVELPPLAPAQRKTEQELLGAFEAARPRILGALLDAAAGALRDRTEVRLPERPRMADFAEWVTAAEGALRWPQHTFLEVYAENRQDANALAIESSPVGPALLQLAAGEGFTGTLTQLLERLAELAGEPATRRRDWPKSARGLRSQLDRVAPNLRASGIQLTHHPRAGHDRTRLLSLSSPGTTVRTVRSTGGEAQNRATEPDPQWTICGRSRGRSRTGRPEQKALQMKNMRPVRPVRPVVPDLQRSTTARRPPPRSSSPSA